MDIPIFSKGKEYISAGRAGDYVGYSSDYVGQLSRSGKIPAKLIGRTWYVDLEALKLHKENRVLGKPKKVFSVQSGVATEANRTNQADQAAAPLHATEFSADSHNSLYFKYSTDSSDLLPPLPIKKGRRLRYHSSGDSTKKSFLILWLVPVTLIILLVVVPVIKSSLTTSTIVRSRSITGNAELLSFIANKTQAAAALLGEGIKQGLYSTLGTSSGKGEIKTFREMLTSGENGLKKEEIRLLLLGENQVGELTDTSASSTTSEGYISEMKPVPTENPFGLPQ